MGGPKTEGAKAADQGLTRTEVKSTGTKGKIDLFSIGVLNSLSAHIAVLDNEGKIVAVNDAWKKFAAENGGSAPRVDVGSSYFSACLQASDDAGVQEAKVAIDGIKKVLGEELSEFELEYACHSPDEQRWFLMRVTPMRFLGSKAVVSHINITEKKLTEQNLVEREKEVTALNIIGRAVSSSLSLEAVTHAILEQITKTIHPDLSLLFLREGEDLVLKGTGPNQTRYQFEGPHLHKVGHCLCGLSVEKGQSIISRDINRDARCSWQECKQAGITSFAAIPLKIRDDVIGTLGIASIESRDFDARRQFLEAIANDVAIYLDNALLYEQVNVYARDLETQLSERKKMEKLLRQTQKMEAIGKLAGGIAHDFNNILSPILGFTELALGDLPEGSSTHADLEEVFKAGNRAKHLVRQILTITRHTEHEQVPFDISVPVNEAIKLIRASIPSTINIVASIAQDLAPILGDATQIHQIAMNLCTNSAQAMEEEGGTLEVTLEQVYWDSKYIVNYKVLPKGYYIKLSVSDTGTGMPPDILESIFDPYFTTKEDGKGNGLGLSVVHGIIKSHGGEINVYSEPGKGSAFTVYFPVVEAEIEPLPEHGRAIPTGNECLLYVDDEVSIVNMGKQFLEKQGYTVTTTTRGREALRLFEQNPEKFGAVITDMTMPELRGDRLARKLRALRPNVPVIICTGFSRHISKTIVRDLGISALLMKPFTQRDLAVAVRIAIDGKTPD